jgi:hypothetical protein
VPRRGGFAPLVALLLAGLVLGGIGTFGFGLWSVSPEPILMAKEMPTDQPEASSGPSEPLARSEAAAPGTPRPLEQAAAARATALTEPANPPEPLPGATPDSILQAKPVAEADPEIIPEIARSPEIDSGRVSTPQAADSGGGARAPLEMDLRAAPMPAADPKGDFVVRLAALRAAELAKRGMTRKISPDPPRLTESDAAVSSRPDDGKIALVETGAAKPVAKPVAKWLAVSAAELDLRDLVMAREVLDREPVDLTTSFSPEDGRAFVHASIGNPGPPTQVSFLWFHGDALYTTVETDVGTSMRWRTWSSAEVWLGEWRVQVVAADGKVLGEKSFSVE